MATKKVKLSVTSDATAYWLVVDKKFIRLVNGKGSADLAVSDMEHVMTGIVEGDTDQKATFKAELDGDALVELTVAVPKKNSRDKGVDYAYFWVQ